MKTQLVKAQNQARGAFDFGRIRENKPRGFPHEVGELRSISNLFYWAHAWSDEGGLIEEHPHQGFEIMSYVIRGELSHYDNKNKAWKSLKAGGAQLIKAGNGITHAEKFMPNTAIFQIWMDPNLRKTLGIPASYEDVSEIQFVTENKEGYTKKNVVGNNSLLGATSEGVEMAEIKADTGTINLNIDSSKINLFYLIHGKIKSLEGELESNDLLKVENGKLSFDIKEQEYLVNVEDITTPEILVSYKITSDGETSDCCGRIEKESVGSILITSISADMISGKINVDNYDGSSMKGSFSIAK